MTTATKFAFSNMLEMDSPLLYQGLEFHTVENFFHAMKVDAADVATRTKMASLDPYAAKRMGKTVKLRLDWEEIKEDVMLYALRHKFQPDTSWGQKLLATGEESITEFNTWHDNYWGHCTCAKCKNKPHHNRLGILLMQVRQKIAYHLGHEAHFPKVDTELKR